MSFLDWTIVIGLNGAVVVVGLVLARGVSSSREWFLAGRRLPWWLVGLSLYATAIDSSDLVADSGGTYELGFRYFVTGWVGTVAGWFVGAHWIFLPMYRAGLYTNAEYLEGRFGVAARVVSVLVQVQYRTLVLGIIGMALALTLTVVCGWSDEKAWWVVAIVAVLAAAYTVSGGLRSVAVTDALQFVVMAVAAVVFWSLVWGEVGGWDGLVARLGEADPRLPDELLHVGRDLSSAVPVDGKTPEEIARLCLLGGEHDEALQAVVRRTPAWMVALGFGILGFAYSVVNHTQSMRLFGARSAWDLKMSAVVASAALIVFTFFNLSMGVLGRALHPLQELLPAGRQDTIYPLLVREFGGVGLTGLLVAGIFAATLSTYDSISSTLSALVTRDLYARLFVRHKSDRHYLRVGRLVTPLIIALSFAYVPFLESGMLDFYIHVTSAFVVPLLTLYLLGTFTRVHRHSGLWGLLAGGFYGVSRLLAPWAAERFGVRLLPPFLMDPYGAYLWSVLLTGGTMLLVTLVMGRDSGGLRPSSGGSQWLEASRLESCRPEDSASEASGVVPLVLGAFFVALGCGLSFWVFW